MNGFLFDFVSTTPIVFLLIFALITGIILLQFIRGLSQWFYNNSQPKLAVNATVIAKRTNVTSAIQSNTSDISMHNHHVHTSYFVSFELDDADRKEFLVSGKDYGIIVEKDIGKLTFQGTRFLGFTRKV